MAIRKIAISVPEDVLRDVDRLAKKSKTTRSALISKVLKEVSRASTEAGFLARINEVFMDEKMLANRQSLSPAEDTNSFSQYLSFRFYKENLDNFKDRTKDSINNFLKTVSEIEDEFLNTLKAQRIKNWEMHDLGLEKDATMYMEENY